MTEFLTEIEICIEFCEIKNMLFYNKIAKRIVRSSLNWHIYLPSVLNKFSLSKGFKFIEETIESRRYPLVKEHPVYFFFLRVSSPLLSSLSARRKDVRRGRVMASYVLGK